MFIVAFDPGLRGAIASIDDAGTLDVVPMPLAAGEMHPGVLASYLVSLNKKIDHVFIEACQAMPKQGVSSMFKYGMGYGMIQGVTAALSLPYTCVKPRDWQRDMHRGTDASSDAKSRSLFAAYNLFPNQDWLASPRCKKPHDGSVDASLIALWGYRLLTGQLEKRETPKLKVVG
jgi:crossover junction endodeoxyribonuclease RuvC